MGERLDEDVVHGIAVLRVGNVVREREGAVYKGRGTCAVWEALLREYAVFASERGKTKTTRPAPLGACPLISHRRVAHVPPDARQNCPERAGPRRVVPAARLDIANAVFAHVLMLLRTAQHRRRLPYRINHREVCTGLLCLQGPARTDLARGNARRAVSRVTSRIILIVQI